MAELIRTVGETTLLPLTVVFMSGEGSLALLERSVGSGPLMAKKPEPAAIFI